jgi:pyruvate/2-oxoglutarate dehydrogenase complex dihydrolipoamide dehydrogenase (E3) component
MSEELKPDICIIGGGAGGIALATGAAQLGAKVVLIERGLMGGDNLHRGSVPSKALLAAANRAHSARQTRAFGITPMTPAINFRALGEHIQSAVAAISPNDSAERLAGFGVQVLRGFAKFVSKDAVSVDNRRILARNFVIATGSSPALPAIHGLDKVSYLTSDTLFANVSRYDHLVILGGGGRALELAQAFLRLGSRVTVIEQDRFLPQFDPELTRPLTSRLTEEGVVLAEGVSCDRVEAADAGGIRLHLSKDGEVDTLDATHLLVMGSRSPNAADLGLDLAGVEHDADGIKVSAKLRTSNRQVYAIGDVTQGQRSATRARHEAGILVRRLGLGTQALAQPNSVPTVIYTSPGLAHIGMSEADARAKYSSAVRVLRWPFSENDLATVERQSEGFAKILAGPSGRILGATIVGEQAAELIQTWCLAVSSGLTVGAVAESIAPYPSYAETSIRAAQGYTMERPPSPGLGKAIGAAALRLLPGRG